jgi:CubicO group peptidase (beta-lactamase class C family)
MAISAATSMGVQAARARIVGRQVPAVSLALVTPTGLEWSRGVGMADLGAAQPATAETVYLWFSMTKIVTATAVMQLGERHALELDRPAAELVPALASATWRGRRVPITIRQLLSHTAGLPNPIPVGWVHPAEAPAPDGRAWAERLLARHTRLAFEPGSRTGYSNLGYLALGQAIAAASGQSYEDYVRAHILRPLGMASTDFVCTESMRRRAATGYQPRWSAIALPLPFLLPRGILGRTYRRYIAFQPFYVDGAAYGGLVGSVEDAARFARLHLHGGEVDGVRLLSPESIAEMQHLSHTGPDLDVGLGWFRKRAASQRGESYVEHLGGGAGFFNVMRLWPDRARAAVLMGNATSYDQAAILNAL